MSWWAWFLLGMATSPAIAILLAYFTFRWIDRNAGVDESSVTRDRESQS